MLKQLQLLFSIHKPKRRAPTVQRDNSDLLDLQQVWCQLRHRFYPDRMELDSYEISWSKRQQKRVLASCNIRARRVVVAKELLEPSAICWIEPVLYHELCHAVIGEDVASPNGKRLWHGAEFRALERRHPDIARMGNWISSGGWSIAVRSNRSRLAWEKRQAPKFRSPSTSTRKAPRKKFA